MGGPTPIAMLLTLKQQVVRRLHQSPEPHERDELERNLKDIDRALNRLDKAVAKAPSPES